MLKLVVVGAAIAVIVLVVTRPSLAKEPLPLDKVVYKDATGKELPYRLLRPAKVEDGKRYPLVVFLHGAGERGDRQREATRPRRRRSSLGESRASTRAS